MEDFKFYAGQAFFACTAFMVFVIAMFTSLYFMPVFGFGTEYDNVIAFGIVVVCAAIGMAIIATILYFLFNEWEKYAVLYAVANISFFFGILFENFVYGTLLMFFIFSLSYFFGKRKYGEGNFVFFLTYLLVAAMSYYLFWQTDPIYSPTIK